MYVLPGPELALGSPVLPYAQLRAVITNICFSIDSERHKSVPPPIQVIHCVPAFEDAGSTQLYRFTFQLTAREFVCVRSICFVLKIIIQVSSAHLLISV